MPIGGNAQVTINVGARLQVLQSSVNEIQKVLDRLQPNSTGFKNLQTILNQITREMDRLQVQASKPFGSQNQFNQTEKTLDKIEDSLNNAQIALGRISFKDLKLSPDQEQQFKDLRNDIAETKKALDSFKNEQKIELFKNADFKKFADSIDSNLIKKNFSEVAQAVSGESERITNEISKLTSKINQASKEISIGENVKNFTGFLDKDKVIKKEFEQFFTQTEQGLKFKPKQQNAFYEYLKEYFSLNDQQINALKKLSAQKVQEVMTSEGYFEPQLRKAKNAGTRQVSYNTQMTELRTQADAAAAAMGTVETAEEKIAEQSNATEDTVRALEERIRQLELQLTGAAQASPEMKNGIAGMTSELNSMKTSLEQANAQFLQLQRQRQTFESIKSAIVNFMGFNQVLNITRNAVRAAIDHIKELDTTMNGIAIVTDMTTADLWKQVDAYSAMAQNFGVTIQGAYEVSKIYYQAGYETNDVLTLTNETLKLSKISGLDYATTTDYMMTAMRGFKLEMEDASRVVDVYSNLAANTAVSQQELAEAMTRTASSMESVGATFEETSAMIATMVAVTRESANNIGSAMKSIASRYGELTKDPAALLDADGEAMSFNKVDTALRSVGITLQTTDHQFRDFTDVIIELAEKWDTLDSAQQRYIATQFAGNRQQSRFLALVSNIDLLQENIANAENSEDVGTLQALKALDSLESKINQVQVAYQQFYTTIGIENAWKTFLDGTRNVIDTLNSLPKLFNAIPLNAIAAISSVISVIKSVLFAGLQLVAKELKNFSTQNNQQVEDQNKEGGQRAANSWIDWFLRVWRGRKGELTSEVQGTMADATGKVLPSTTQNKPDTTDRSAQNSKKLFGTISVEGKRAAQTISTIGSAFSTLSLLINTTSQSGKVLSGTLMSLGGVITTVASAATGNVFGIVTGILNVISGISTAYESAEERLARLNKEAEELNNKAKEAKANYNTLQRSVDKLQELEDKRYESTEAAEEYQTAVDELADKFPEMIAGFDAAGNIILDTTDAERILAEARQKSRKATYEAAEAELAAAKAKVDEAKANIPQLNQTNSGKVYLEISGNEEALDLNQRRFDFLSSFGSDVALPLNTNIDKQFGFSIGLAKLISEEGYEFLENYIEVIEDELGDYNKINLELLEKDLNSGKYANNQNALILKELFPQINSTLSNVEQINSLLEQYSSLDPFSNEAQKLVIEIQNLINASPELQAYFSDTNDALNAINTAIANYISENAIFKARKKEVISTWQNTTSNDDKAWNYLSESANAAAMITKRIANEAGEDWKDKNGRIINESTWTEYQEQAEIFWNNLDKNQKEMFNKMAKDTNRYSSADFQEAFGEVEGWESFKTTVIEYYSEGVSSIQESLLRNLNKRLGYTDRDSIATSDKEFNNLGQFYNKWIELSQNNFTDTAIEAKYLNNILSQYSQISDSGFRDSAEKFGLQALNLYEQLNQIPYNIRTLIFDSILENGFNTIEGINNILKTVETYSSEIDNLEVIKEILLKGIQNNIIPNISLGIQSAVTGFIDKWEDASKEFNKLSKGLDIKEVQGIIDKAATLGIEFDLSSFVQDGDKLILSAENATKYWEAYSAAMTKEAGDWESKIKNAWTVINPLLDGSLGSRVKFLNEKNRIAAKTLLGENYDKYFTETGVREGVSQEELDKALQSGYENVTKGLKQYYQYIEWARNSVQRSIDFSLGEYTKYIGENAIADVASGRIKLNKNDYDARAAKETINKVYSSLVSDILSNGFDEINLDDYEGLISPDEIQKVINQEKTSGSYADFVRRYVDFTGESTEEINALIVQAMEKDAAATSGAAQDALRDVNFYSKERASASLDTIQKLADALGVSINIILGEYIAGLDEYSVNLSNVPLNNITNSTEILFDSISSVINSIAKYISAGLEGKLSGADITNFNAQLSAYEDVDQLVAADFVQTTQGLKLSEEAAFRLYSQLQKIEGIQHLITFNDLMGSLRDTNEHYKSMSTTLARIAELNRDINEIDSNGGDTARRDMYQQELDIAKEIAAVRLTTDDSGFDFMSNKLSAPLQNGVDYIDSIGKMFKSMNTAATTGKGLMDATDFYNIVNELNNMASVGGEIEFLGMKLDGSLESASELIQKGFSALKNIDGEGTKVDLSSFGVDFASGADAMGKNIEEGIHAMAKSQIEMIDAMIQLLETVVAMEKLGDIDVDSNGVFNFDDIFEVFAWDEDGEKAFYKFTEQWQKAIDELAKIDPNSDLGKALDAVKVNGYTMRQIFSTAYNDLQKLGLDEQSYAALMTSLVDWAKSGNYDLDNLYASIKEVMASSNFNGEFQIGDLHIQVGYGQTVVFDPKTNTWKDAKNNDHKTAEEAMRANIEAQIPNAQKDSTVVLDNGNYQTTIEANGVDLKVVTTTSGEQTYTIEGVKGSFSSQNEALYALYEQTQEKSQESIGSFQQFVLNITGEVLPEITIANPEKIQQATQTQLNELAQALVGDSDEEVIRAARAIGIEIDVSAELTAAQRAQIAELAGIESKNVALNITANYTGDSAKAFGELLEKDPIEINATVNITDVNDESGKLGVGEDGKVTITDLTASGLGTIALNDCEFSVVDGIAKITKDGNQIAFIPLENLEATGIGELPEGNCTFTYVPGEGITISNGTVSITIPEEVLKGTGNLNANNTEVSYNGETPQLSNEEIEVPLDEYLKGSGVLTSGACNIVYQGDVPYVTFADGKLNIPLNDYLEAGGTLTKDNCHVVYNSNTDKLDVYDENNQLLGTIQVPLNFESTDGVLENVQVTFSEKGLEIIKDGKSVTGGPIPLEDLTAEGTGDLLSLALQWLGGKENIDTSKVIPTDGLDLGATTATVKVTQITPEIEEAVRNDLLNRINKTIAAAPEWPEANVSAVTKPSTAVNMLSNTPDHIIQNKVVEAQVKVDTEEAEKKLESVKQKNEDVHDTITSTTSKVNVDNSEANSKLNTTESEAYQTKNALNSVKGTGFFNNSQIISAIQQVINKVREGISALSNLSSTTASVTVSTSSGAGSGRDPYRSVRGLATGNVALAKGRQTLLGELGPELYVTGGHYYVAGQNGAEFINLPDDAIVFNHLQTERLLKNGSAGRGKAVGGEKRAIAHAKGNAEGPAMASASAALAALKQIRAMWDSMLHASLSDLGSKAGLGKKTGGGGNDKGQTVKLDSGYIRDLERWYNLLRQIDRLEQDINYEEKLRSKLQADTVANGELIYESQRRTYEMLQRELDDRVELASLKKGYYEQRMAEIQAGPWGQLFYFNEEGVPQMKNLQFLADVFASSDEGGAVHSAREQYAMLQQAGFGSLLQYKEDGSIIEWTDDEGKPREDAYKEAVEAFSAKLDAQTEEVNSLREDYIEEMGNILDLQTQQNEILAQIRENTIAVEQEVLKAIEDSRKREIDELQKQRDVLSDSTDKFIDGLTDSLNKEREMYNSQQEDTELLQMRRQLAILQRSGGPASQIRSLQQQIRQREQEAYFEEQENQINAIKEASNLQLERLDAQISLMQETLEYQKAQGLLWDQVHEVMQGTHQEITQFVTGNNSEWWAKSASQTQNDLVELDNKIGQWVAHRDDISALGETMKNAISNGIVAITSVMAKVSESQSYTVSGTGSYVLPSSNSSNTGSYSGGTPSGANQSKPKTNNTSKTTSVTPKATSTNHGYSFAFNGAQYSNSGYSSASEAANAAQARFNSMVSGMQIPSWQVKKFQEVFSGSLKVYKKGGLIDYTGPAWVDGTKKKPEGILNAEQLDMLRNSVLTRSNPIAALIADYSDSVRGTANSNTYNTIDRGESTVIENAQVVMNVSKMSNDYDARQAGRAALDEMIRISRKTKPTGVSRR